MTIPSYAPLISQPVPIFLTVMAIIVIVPLVLNRWKIPTVIGLIFAGVAVGPYGLDLLARDMSFEVFGEVGILYLMFLAGIEIDMMSLKRNLTRGLVFGFFTFIIPLVLGTLAAVWLLGLTGACGLLLGSMFAAHTLISYPIVSRFGITKNPAVVVAVAGTIVTVLGSLVVLAAVTSGLNSHDSRGILKLVVGLVAFCLGVLYIYPRVTKWFFRTYSDGILQFVWVLALVFLAASVAGWLGIEGVFGAFFAGLVLNRYIPGRSVLMSRLEFVGNALFIPYFLIGVGMFINLRVVLQGWDTLYVAGVMIAVAISGKWVAAYITQKIFHYTSAERSIIYQLSNAHTAVALAVVMIGYGLNLFGSEILNGTILMILVTCSVSSVGAERAAAKIKLRMESELDHSAGDKATRAFSERIMVSVANPMTVPSLMEMALMMRHARRDYGEIIALHVRNDASLAAREVGQAALESAACTALAANTEITTVERFDLNVTTGILNAAVERDATSIIIGLHRKANVIDSFFGDKIEQLVRSTNRMVVVARCFIPVSTISRLVVMVPPKAEHEAGFRRWVESLGALAHEVGCRAIFCCPSRTRPLIKAVLAGAKLNSRVEYRTLTTTDDFILLSNKVLEDDLMAVVSARRASVSFNEEIDELPRLLEKNFSRNNLLILYPGQSGPDETLTLATAMATDFSTSPTHLWLAVRSRYRLFKRIVKNIFRHSPQD